MDKYPRISLSFSAIPEFFITRSKISLSVKADKYFSSINFLSFKGLLTNCDFAGIIGGNEDFGAFNIGRKEDFDGVSGVWGLGFLGIEEGVGTVIESIVKLS